MHRHILIPVALDHEKLVPRKIELARHLLDEGGQITLLTVLENVPGFVAEFIDLKAENHLKERIRQRLEVTHAVAGGIRSVVETGKAGLRIAQYARDNDVDLIIVGSHHPGAQDYFLGSTASRAVGRAHCSVYILR